MVLCNLSKKLDTKKIFDPRWLSLRWLTNTNNNKNLTPLQECFKRIRLHSNLISEFHLEDSILLYSIGFCIETSKPLADWDTFFKEWYIECTVLSCRWMVFITQRSYSIQDWCYHFDSQWLSCLRFGASFLRFNLCGREITNLNGRIATCIDSRDRP